MKKILISLMAIALVIGLVGAGTMAYFSDTETSSANTFTSGTLVLKLANDNATWTDGVTGTWVSPAGWAPGQSFTSTLYLKNTGSVGAHAVYENWTNLAGDTALSDWIQVTEISDSIPWGSDPAYGTNYVGNFLPLLDMSPFDGKLSLYELQSWGDRKTASSTPKPWEIKVTATEDPAAPPDALPAGGTLGLRFTFKLMEGTGNDMQGKTCTIDLTVMASQVLLPPMP